ncbi:hypothetical protein D6C00_00625 [Thiohalobacter thiocyanaticus]|uniref:Uncharacterized protein n=2 Tax=Thiohalobacter thiocyanaticus TaxID=585455 RepID=A0A426QFW0_9GAMM|nr:hypothetical protein D6C00_00625 [Thiohalobacter thiocyanaticus]
MSPLDEGFRQRIDHVYRDWRTWLARRRWKCPAQGQFGPRGTCEQVATFSSGRPCRLHRIAKKAPEQGAAWP